MKIIDWLRRLFRKLKHRHQLSTLRSAANMLAKWANAGDKRYGCCFALIGGQPLLGYSSRANKEYTERFEKWLQPSNRGGYWYGKDTDENTEARILGLLLVAELIEDGQEPPDDPAPPSLFGCCDVFPAPSPEEARHAACRVRRDSILEFPSVPKPL